MRLPFNGSFRTTQGFNDPCCRASYYRFGMNGHNGQDIGLPHGTPVLAPHGGTVLEATNSPTGYGLYAKIQNGTEGSVLAHLSRLDVGQGQVVTEGRQIGVSGNTGNSSGPHLHWGYYRLPRNRANGFDGFIDQTPYLISKQEAPVAEPIIPADRERVHYIDILGREPDPGTALGKKTFSKWLSDAVPEIIENTQERLRLRKAVEELQGQVKILTKRVVELESQVDPDSIVITRSKWSNFFDAVKNFFRGR